MYTEIEFLRNRVKKLRRFIASVGEVKSSRSERTLTRRKCGLMAEFKKHMLM